MKDTIFIVEDEADIAGLIRFNLEAAGFQTVRFERAEPALAAAILSPPALFLLDIMMPGLDGLELCRRIRAVDTLSRVPVIFVTARMSEDDRLKGFDVGADDYLTKPFSPRELVARVEAILRRYSDRELGTVIRFGNIEIDSAAMILRVNGRIIATTTLEFRLLEFLARSPGLVFSRERLLEAVWGSSKYVSLRSVDVYISKLREKIERNVEDPHYLLTVRGAGYRLATPKPGS